MRIIYCLPDVFKPGGIERIISIKANYLNDIANFEVFIVTTGQLNKEKYYFFSPNIKFIDLGINYDETLSYPFIKRLVERKKKKVLHKKKLSALLYNLKADIVISTFTHEADFLPKIKDGSKKILEFHFFRGHKIKYANSFKFSILTKLGYYYRNYLEENYIVKSYDQFVVLTEEDRKLWATKIPNVIAIPNILPFEVSRKSELINKRAITVGRLDAQKGFDRLIDIWKDIVKQYSDWILTIYGEGSDEVKLKNQIISNFLEKNVQIFAPEKNIKEKYYESSMFLMTSRYEGMPMTMLEAMSCGLPVVSYDFKCGPKDLITDSIDGFIIKDGDKDSFVNKICYLINHSEKRKDLGKSAVENINRFSVNKVMPKWIDLFHNITTNK